MPVEVPVVLVADVALGPDPEGGRLVDGLLIRQIRRPGPGGPAPAIRPGSAAGPFGRHDDRQADVVGIPLNDRAQPRPIQQVVLALPQMEHDCSAPGRHLGRLQRVRAPAVGLPADPFAGGQSRPAGGQLHPVGHDERRVETHAELPDQRCVLPLVAGQRVQEIAGARLGDRADVLDHLGPAHADAIVRHGDRAGAGVVADPDPQLALVVGGFGPGHRFQAQPVDGVRGVGDQFPQEDLLVAVQRVHHQIKDLDDLGLEAEVLRFRLRGH